MRLPESMRVSTPLFALVVAIMAPVSAPQAPAEFDLLITNGRIVNGTGNHGFLPTSVSAATRLFRSVILQTGRPPGPLMQKG